MGKLFGYRFSFFFLLNSQGAVSSFYLLSDRRYKPKRYNRARDRVYEPLRRRNGFFVSLPSHFFIIASQRRETKMKNLGNNERVYNERKRKKWTQKWRPEVLVHRIELDVVLCSLYSVIRLRDNLMTILSIVLSSALNNKIQPSEHNY